MLEKSPSKKCKIRYLQQQLGIKNSDVDIIEVWCVCSMAVVCGEIGVCSWLVCVVRLVYVVRLVCSEVWLVCVCMVS